MITFLKVENLAIVDDISLEPGPGLNVLTGETGAGKSLLIDSLELLSGSRASSDAIRSGAEKMSAQCVIEPTPAIISILRERGIEVDDGDDVIVRREMSAAGRGRAMVNGVVVPVRDLADLMERLIEIHGQDQSRARIAGQSFRELVDAFGNHHDLLGATRSAYREWEAAAADLARIETADADRAARIDLLTFQANEIAAAALRPGEDERLREERALLANAQEMTEATAAAFALLDEDDDAAGERIGRAIHLLQPLAREVGEVAEIVRELEESLLRLQECSRTIGRLADEVRHDPERLDEIEQRLALIERLVRKYGGTIEAAIEHHDRAARELEELSDYEVSLDRLRKRTGEALSSYRERASALSDARRTSAETLQRAIENELRDLALERTRVVIALSTDHDDGSPLRLGGTPVAFGPDGFDRIEILIAPNLGEEPRPLHRIASGGELSRLQLAIAAATFRHSDRDAGATLVFDEIDAGIGGRVAEVVGQKLQSLARTSQVICVTHLPQIASLGSTHFRVWKEDIEGRTRARIEKLATTDARISEIARMLGGDAAPESARQHAAALLGQQSESSRSRRAGASR